MRNYVWLPVCAGLVALSACSAEYDTADSMAGPDIAPEAAPDVAMSFAYDYRLDDDAIAAVQETHAAACEKLGLARCRISGFDYRITPDEEVVANLEIRIDPRIARVFGKDATKAVEEAEGALARMQFDGEDMSSLIEGGTRDASSARSEIETIEAQLSAAQNLSDEEAARLRIRLAELRDRARSSAIQADEARARLAVTPMRFAYYGDVGVPGFGGDNPLEQAWHALVASTVALVRIVLTAAAALLPWALLVALLFVIWRSRPLRSARAWLALRTTPGEPEA
ncbi:hypothetical protein WJS89_06700 [Sphingomicrobium sp. XHP0235]|uniref:hypothetical protein n=1 Tax=Sphingomicrobium aquimarinum TaxID=3133971 RepID=UPI0031FE7B42